MAPVYTRTMSKKQTYWFKRRRYGWGWVPVTWKGWVTILLYPVAVFTSYLATMFGTSDSIFSEPIGYTVSVREVVTLVLFFLLFSGLLLLTCYRKGPKPKWRWGKKPSDKKDEDY